MRFVLVTLLALLACPVQAQVPSAAGTPGSPATTRPNPARHPRQSLQQRFDTANTTHDGKLTLDQAKTGKMNRIVKNYDTIDTAKKGYVTMDDIHAFNRAQRAARKPAAQ